MKLFFVALLLCVLVVPHSTQEALCAFCGGLFPLPTNWAHAQELLRYGCGKFDELLKPCIALVNAADLTASYSAMYPFISQLKEMGCKNFCPAT